MTLLTAIKKADPTGRCVDIAVAVSWQLELEILFVTCMSRLFAPLGH
jgi:hypothetical protein